MSHHTRIAVIVTDAGQAANVNGGVCETFCRTFEMPEDMAKFVSERGGGYNAINFALVLDEPATEQKG